jgi:C-terminal processing protease CtpA/Prc
MKDSGINVVDFPRRMLALEEEIREKVGNYGLMVSPQQGSTLADDDTLSRWLSDVPKQIGAARSWVPILGKIVWELPKSLQAKPYHAYICEMSDGRRTGYIRVPHYTYDMEAVNIFEDVIARFETETAAMVFDQVDNPGGSMFQMYALLAMLTERVLPLPQHQITISDDQVAVAKNVLADAQAGEALPSNERPSPELVSYSRFVLAEKEAGRGNAAKASNPVYLFGVAEIVPAKTRYTKRIVVLINELTFSAGEFLAAILQDNKRAILFGQRTVGAGGCVKQIPFPSTLNIVKKGLVSGGYLSITWTIARRTTGEYIENIGVQPDVICEEDAQSGYSDYRRALLACLANP